MRYHAVSCASAVSIFLRIGTRRSGPVLAGARYDTTSLSRPATVHGRGDMGLARLLGHIFVVGDPSASELSA